MEIKLYRGELLSVDNQADSYEDFVCTGIVGVWNTREITNY